MTEKVQLVSSVPWPELVEDLARKLNCSLEEAYFALSPPLSLTPREAPLLPRLLPE